MTEPLTLTMTMCKRPELARRTLRSFMRSCLDQDLIVDWRAVDDGTDPAELEKLQKEFKQLTILRNPNKGHANALNLLLSGIRTRLIMHLEDDWLFPTPGHFIRDSQLVMSLAPEVAVVCLRTARRGELLEGPGISFEYHTPRPDRPLKWPGYTLNPSVQDLERISRLGPFKNTRGFEYEFGLRYRDAGLKVAYLTPPASRNWIRHLGKTSAYRLNQTRR